MKYFVDILKVESGWMALNGHDPNRRMSKATLVIGDERVFTEREVKAIAIQAIDMIRAAAKAGIHVGQACGYIGRACADAGINIDPS
jgi:hypothetical protein